MGQEKNIRKKSRRKQEWFLVLVSKAFYSSWIDGWFHVQKKVFWDSYSLTNHPCKKLESIWKIICKCVACISFKINSTSKAQLKIVGGKSGTHGCERSRLQSMVWIFKFYFHSCFPAGSALDLLQDVWKCGSLLISDSCYDQWFLSFPIKKHWCFSLNCVYFRPYYSCNLLSGITQICNPLTTDFGWVGQISRTLSTLQFQGLPQPNTKLNVHWFGQGHGQISLGGTASEGLLSGVWCWSAIIRTLKASSVTLWLQG